MKRIIGFFIFSIIILGFSACNLTDNDQPIPFFLDLSMPTVKAPKDLGDDTHKITEVWVFADNQILGVFPLPAKVPVVLTGKEVEITIFAGIRNNGMNDTPVFYPFYQVITKKVNASANEVINIPLTFEYKPETKFPVNESFETGNVFNFDIDSKPETFITVTADDASLGANCGVVTLNNNLRFVEVGTTAEVQKGENSRGESYIEFDYKGNGEIAVGIAKFRGGVINIEYVLFVPGRDEWNKIYVDVTDKLSPDDYEQYRLLLAFTKTGSSLESKVYVDNFKHVHF